MNQEKMEIAKRMVGKTVTFSNKEGEFIGVILEAKNEETFIVELPDKVKCEVSIFEIYETRQ